MLQKVEEFLTQRDIPAYLVGGCVRDHLLKRATQDVDIAVAASALSVAHDIADALHGSYVLLHQEQAIARVVFSEGQPSPRRSLEEGQGPSAGEGSSPARKWNFDFSTIQEDIESDLHRRDFTVNAMAVKIGTTTPDIIDPFGGRSDLEKGQIRAVRESAFRDDPARLLRAVRLAAEYDFSIEKQTEALIKGHSHLLARVAGERIREELCRLLALPGTASHLRYLDQLGLLTVIFPELTLTKEVDQPKEHFWNVFRHSIQTVAAVECLLSSKDRKGDGSLSDPIADLYLIPKVGQHFAEKIGNVERSVLIKLAALLHDIAKPQTKNVERDGRVHFFGHTKKGAAMGRVIMRSLRFGTQQSKAVQQMIEQHLRPWQLSSDATTPTRRAIYRYFRDTGDSALDTIWLALADYLATQGPRLDLNEWQEHVRMMNYVISQGLQEEKGIVSPPKLIDGHDLINIFDMQPGHQVGECLQAVQEAQATGEISTRDEALAFVRRQISQYRKKE